MILEVLNVQIVWKDMGTLYLYLKVFVLVKIIHFNRDFLVKMIFYVHEFIILKRSHHQSSKQEIRL